MGNFTDTNAWKSFIIKFGGIASAVVIVGALFKIQHWPGASIMITIGMSSEVVIFLLSALDTFHPDVDWSVVYPELGHDEAHPHTEAEKTQVVLDNGEPFAIVETDNTKKVSECPAPLPMPVPAPVPMPAPPPVYASAPPAAPVPMVDFSKLDIDTTAIAEGMKKFGDNLGKLEIFETAAQAATELSGQLQSAAGAVGNFADAYGNSTKDLSGAVEELNVSYRSASASVAEAGRQTGEMVAASGRQISQATDDAAKTLAESYKTITDSINGVGREACESVVMSGRQLSEVILSATDSFAGTFTLIDQEIKQNLADFAKNNNDYNKSLESLNQNMSALNAAYELQAQEVAKYQKRSAEIGQYVESFVAGLDKSTDANHLFYKEMSHLNEHIAELNNIYGSMLSAVEMVTKRK